MIRRVASRNLESTNVRAVRTRIITVVNNPTRDRLEGITNTCRRATRFINGVRRGLHALTYLQVLVNCVVRTNVVASVLRVLNRDLNSTSFPSNGTRALRRQSNVVVYSVNNSRA